MDSGWHSLQIGRYSGIDWILVAEGNFGGFRGLAGLVGFSHSMQRVAPIVQQRGKVSLGEGSGLAQHLLLEALLQQVGMRPFLVLLEQLRECKTLCADESGQRPDFLTRPAYD